jgi:hypothetical protein
MLIWVLSGATLSSTLVLAVFQQVFLKRLRQLKRQNACLVQQNRQLLQCNRGQASEVLELTSALRAEKAHVEQLSRQTRLMTMLLNQPGAAADA